MNATKYEVTASDRTEAAIYAQGTNYSQDDLLRLWKSHLSECEQSGSEPENVQVFFQGVLGGAEDIENINAIAKLLMESGPAFSGGVWDSAMVAAREWDGCGFTVDGVSDWVRAEVWTPDVADELHAAGVRPSKLVAAVGSDAVYAACNGDMAVADLIAAYEAE